MMTLSAEQQAMVALFQRHVDAELAGDLDTTMATMTDSPHLNHVASMAGGVSLRRHAALMGDSPQRRQSGQGEGSSPCSGKTAFLVAMIARSTGSAGHEVLP